MNVVTDVGTEGLNIVPNVGTEVLKVGPNVGTEGSNEVSGSSGSSNEVSGGTSKDVEGGTSMIVEDGTSNKVADGTSQKVDVTGTSQVSAKQFDVTEFKNLCDRNGNLQIILCMYDKNQAIIKADEEALKAYNEYYERQL